MKHFASQPSQVRFLEPTLFNQGGNPRNRTGIRKAFIERRFRQPLYGVYNLKGTKQIIPIKYHSIFYDSLYEVIVCQKEYEGIERIVRALKKKPLTDIYVFNYDGTPRYGRIFHYYRDVYRKLSTDSTEANK